MREIAELQATGKALIDFALVNRKTQESMTETLRTHLTVIALGVNSATLDSWLNDYQTSLQYAITTIQGIVG